MRGVFSSGHPLHRITGSLAGKLVIAIGIIIVFGGGVSLYALIRSEKNNLLNNTIKYASSYSDLVKRSARDAMLTFRRESIQRTLESIGSREDIKGIRIYSGSGKVFYSSQRKEIGRTTDRKSFPCVGCHADPLKPAAIPTARSQWTIDTGREGYRVLTFTEPIYNEPSCSSAACHVHSGTQRVLGVLVTDFSLLLADRNIEEQTIAMTVFAVIFISISSVILYSILRRLVVTPASTLSQALGKVASGDLSQEVAVTSRDEMGLLTRSFNEMTGELKASREMMENWTQALEDEVAKKTGELKKSRDKLIQAERLAALGRMTSDVAHEIRNPLTAIGGFARKLEKVVGGQKEKEYAGILIDEVDKLEKILKNVLTYSKNPELRRERQDIGELVQEALKVYGELCSRQSVRVEVQTKGDLPPVLLDKGHIIQAIGNLISNAVDAMPSGGALTITAAAERLHGVLFVTLRVSDTGEGIPADKLPLIFDPFYSTKEIGRGTGLGLSIARKIVERHGGFVRAESLPGEGSSFFLYFPCQDEQEAGRISCWEYMKCAGDKDTATNCPAYPHFGRSCWVVAGTFCEGRIQGTFAQKHENCRKCEFYQKVTNNKL